MAHPDGAGSGLIEITHRPSLILMGTKMGIDVGINAKVQGYNLDPA